jgi:flagellar motor protein MotB
MVWRAATRAQAEPLTRSRSAGHTVAVLKVIAEIVGSVSNGIVVTGHTDARPRS